MKTIVAVKGSAQPRFKEIPSPENPAPDEVICETLRLGICGTDREILLSEDPWTPEGSDYIVLGHECLARVVEVGVHCEELQVGDLVVPLVRRAHDITEKRADLLPFGKFVERGIFRDHGFSARYWIDHPRYLLKIDPGIKEIAVMTEPLSVSEKAIHEALLIQKGRFGGEHWSVSPPRVLVVGMGPIAFMGLLGGVARGWPTTVAGRDPHDSFRAAKVRELGGKYLQLDELRSILADVEGMGFDLILECTGNDAVGLEVAETLRSCGVLVWIGADRVPRPAHLNISLLMRNCLMRNQVILGTVNSAVRDFHSSLEIIAGFHRARPGLLESLITDRLGVDESLDHYIHRRSQSIKAVVQFN